MYYKYNNNNQLESIINNNKKKIFSFHQPTGMRTAFFVLVFKEFIKGSQVFVLTYFQSILIGASTLCMYIYLHYKQVYEGA